MVKRHYLLSFGHLRAMATRTCVSCAASALRCVGGGDKDTVQVLVDALKTEKDYGVRYSIADALMVPGRDISIAKIAVPALIAVLSKDKHGGIRQTAMNSIARYFEYGRSAVPALAEVLHNEKDREVRYFAVDALGKVGGDDALIALISGLKDKDSGVRESVKSSLEFIGKPATGLLKLALKMEKEESVRQSIREVLKQIDPSLKTIASVCDSGCTSP